MLNLFGSIRNHLTTHDLRGLNVQIQLKKTVFLNWPRLLRTEEKSNWIKYDLNHTDDNLELFERYLATLERTCKYRFRTCLLFNYLAGIIVNKICDLFR